MERLVACRGLTRSATRARRQRRACGGDDDDDDMKKKRPAAKKEGEGGAADSAAATEAHVQLISTENGLSDDERDNEGMEGYHAGGYHPVAIGDKFKQRQYTVRMRVWVGCARRNQGKRFFTCHASLAPHFFFAGARRPRCFRQMLPPPHGVPVVFCLRIILSP